MKGAIATKLIQSSKPSQSLLLLGRRLLNSDGPQYITDHSNGGVVGALYGIFCAKPCKTASDVAWCKTEANTVAE